MISLLSDTKKLRRKLGRRLMSLLCTISGSAPGQGRPGDARQILAAVHRTLADELPLHLRLHELFDHMNDNERLLLVEQLASSTHSGAAIREVAGMRSHGRGPFFSQEGEDLILSDLFPANHRGFYVDVGAHHPYRFSNTVYFFLRGWSGINIDAAPGTVTAFARARPRDITIECAVGEQEAMCDFFVFDEPALNTLEPSRARQLEQETTYRIKEIRRLPVRRLDSILDQHLPPSQGIDFLSVDVEEHELSVVKSNDWKRFRPRFVLLELLGRSLLEMRADPVVQTMQQFGYEPFVKGVRTVFFRDAEA